MAQTQPNETVRPPSPAHTPHKPRETLNWCGNKRSFPSVPWLEATVKLAGCSVVGDCKGSRYNCISGYTSPRGSTQANKH